MQKTTSLKQVLSWPLTALQNKKNIRQTMKYM
jgi:hypothetical protein